MHTSMSIKLYFQIQTLKGEPTFLLHFNNLILSMRILYTNYVLIYIYIYIMYK